MEPNEKVYAIHWEVEELHPTWQLTSQNFLRVDVTSQFDAAYRIIAYTDLSDNEVFNIRDLVADGIIKAESCGQGGFKGFDGSIWNHVSPPGRGYSRWRVTNCAKILPGWLHSVKSRGGTGRNVSSWLTKNPYDGYQVQFNAVPWGVFTRYWRKPINLDKRFHTQKSKSRWGKNSGYAIGSASIEVLDFDLTLLKDHKTFFADFSFINSNRTRTSNVDMALWMMTNVKGFSFLTDRESPFVREEDEVLFTLEWM